MPTQQTEEQGDEETKSCKPRKIEVMGTLRRVCALCQPRDQKRKTDNNIETL